MKKQRILHGQDLPDIQLRHACELSNKFLKEIGLTLQAIRDQEVPNEEGNNEGIPEAENIYDRPRKRLFKDEGH
jgi:hypothetical protein